MKIKLATIVLVAGLVTGCRCLCQKDGSKHLPMAPQPTQVTYSVVGVAASDEAKNLAAGIRSGVRGSLLGRGYIVTESGGDGIITLSVSRRKVAELGSYRAYEGSVLATATIDGVLKGEKTFIKTGERGIDEASAEKNVKDGLDAQIGSWLKSVLPAADFTRVKPRK